MIHITVKVSNDHSSYTEHFEADELFLSTKDVSLKAMIDKSISSFNQEVDEVIIKTKMEV